MGKRDIRLKPYLSDDVRFADIINASVFQGKQIILPQHLSVQDSVRATAIESHQNKKEIQRFGDVIKKAALGTNFIVVSLENQNDIHYAMPLRSFISEAADYQIQYDRIRKCHEELKDLNGSEYISGFSKEDRIIPVITIVLYYGERKWDGATDLYGLMDVRHYPKEIRQQLRMVVNNFHINLLDVRHMNNPDVFQSDLRQVFNFLKRDSDKDALMAYLEEHKQEYDHLSWETVDMIGQLSKFDVSKFQRQDEEEGGKHKMCKAIDDLMNDAMEEGRKRERAKMEEEQKYFKRQILNKLHKSHFSKDQIEKVEEIMLSVGM